MKKIAMGMAALAALAVVSCSEKKVADGDAAEKFSVSAATADSVNTMFGSYVGTSILGEYEHLDSTMRAEQPKEDIIKGIEYALGAPDKKGVTVGMQIGLQMLNNLNRNEEMGIKVDRSAVLAAFKKAFMADSIDREASRAAQMEYQMMMNRLQQEAKEFEDAQKAKSPEALENVAAGEKLLAADKAKNPEIRTSESGLSYYIENPGDTAKVKRNDLVKVKYTGRLADGTVFDSSDEARMSPAGVVKGFGEGLQMLGKGGKATLYIPGELGYGVDGAPRAGIGPNAMLIFDIEVLDINPKN